MYWIEVGERQLKTRNARSREGSPGDRPRLRQRGAGPPGLCRVHGAGGGAAHTLLLSGSLRFPSSVEPWSREDSAAPQPGPGAVPPLGATSEARSRGRDTGHGRTPRPSPGTQCPPSAWWPVPSQEDGFRLKVRSSTFRWLTR